MGAWILTAVLGSSALAADSFLANLRKAQQRDEPQERLEYYARALAAWTSADGSALLADGRFGKGQAEYELDQPSNAASDAAQALTLDPNNDAAYLLRGKAFLRLKRWPQAERDLSAYAALKSDDVDGWLALGEAQRGLGGFSSALASFRRAASLAPDDARPVLGEARAWAGRKRWKASLAALGPALTDSRSPSAEVLAQKAAGEEGLGRNDDALADYAAALRKFDARLFELERSDAHPVEVALLRDQAATAYASACAAGLKSACADQLPAARRPKSRIKSDAGDRIYAN